MAVEATAALPLHHLSVSLQHTASYHESCMSVADFARSAEAVLPFFDHLGPVFSVARHEFLTKLQSLKAARPTDPATTTLADVVAADTAAGVATAKGSATRCLHRLLSAILFVKILLGRLAASRAAPLREAASDAYEAALAPFHTYLIKTVVRGGLLTLPSREHFLSALGETEDSARPRCEEVAQSCSAVVVSVSRLLSGIDFPVSDVWFWPSSK